MIVMRDEMVKPSNDRRSRSCLRSSHGHFFIPTSRILGKSRYQRDLAQLELAKQQKQRKEQKKKKRVRKSDGKQNKKAPPEVAGDGDGGDDNDASC